MERYGLTVDKNGRPHAAVPYRGMRLLSHPMYSKGTAFTAEERQAFGLDGLLPHTVSTLEQQSLRVYNNISRKQDPLEKFIGLASLQDRNEYLFYRVLLDHIQEFLPIVYTPTVGQACQEFSHIFRRGRGIWITPEHRGRIYDVLGNAPYDDVRLIVVTDNERILGLGDQGAGGMGIPIGKLALYTAAAGIPPWQTLPISLDVGTDNQTLLADELYLGWRAPRLRGPEYDSLVEEFVQAVKKRFPKALLQWEDFKKNNAFRLLDRYQKQITSFNDDIQGTAAVGVAGMIAGARVTGIPLQQQRVVILGAGAAGVGIARLIRETLRQEGLSGDALTQATVNLDSKGLLVDDEPINDVHKRDFAWPAAMAEKAGLGKGQPRDLLAVIRALHPTMLIGTSGEPGAFTEEAIREMGKHVERPLVFPMSNPTSMSEAKPADVLRWTEGRALIATGSPFEPVPMNGRMHVIGQGNNVYIFPGVGLGALVCEAKEVTTSMFSAAARSLANTIHTDELESGSLFPSAERIREVTAAVAEAVVKDAIACGVARRHIDAKDIPSAVAQAMWTPTYLPEEPAPQEWATAFHTTTVD
ncbi:NAD-dependent malic enzyme [Geothrix sp. PMB-07]|uniref:NAD-dependent malic enzyme n=1 Tax=Geothrix sp. PMB-07 TaxID=3068640 RepID=UPI00274072A3|nr:NAD-dependent malic enzyme [Geothrix sp. PMB-07]WLT32177.1 NAD-dependent malic enzyme [Geothrix sp. PMB-07]